MRGSIAGTCALVPRGALLLTHRGERKAREGAEALPLQLWIVVVDESHEELERRVPLSACEGARVRQRVLREVGEARNRVPRRLCRRVSAVAQPLGIAARACEGAGKREEDGNNAVLHEGLMGGLGGGEVGKRLRKVCRVRARTIWQMRRLTSASRALWAPQTHRQTH